MKKPYKVTFGFDNLNDARWMHAVGEVLRQCKNTDSIRHNLADYAKRSKFVKLSTPSKKGGRK